MKAIVAASARVRQNRGTAMVVALVIILVMGMVASATTVLLLRRHRDARRMDQFLQASYLADSALARALARLSADKTYRGEVWKVELTATGTTEAEETENSSGPSSADTAAEATIEIAPDSESLARLKITVTAIYPVHPVQRASAMRELIVPAPLARAETESGEE